MHASSDMKYAGAGAQAYHASDHAVKLQSDEGILRALCVAAKVRNSTAMGTIASGPSTAQHQRAPLDTLSMTTSSQAPNADSCPNMESVTERLACTVWVMPLALGCRK